MDSIKREFISYKKDSKYISDWMAKIEDYENAINKNITAWDKEDALGFYKEQKLQYIESLYRLNATLQTFINYCMIHDYMTENVFFKITVKELVECLDLDTIKMKMVKRKDVLEQIKNIENPCDKFIALGLFEGIRGRNDLGILEARISDIKGNKLTLMDGSVIDISDELKEIAIQSASTFEYIAKGGVRSFPLEVDKDKIIKTTLRRDARVNTQNMIPGRVYLIRHLKLFGDLIGIDITPMDMLEAGRVDFIREEVKKGITVEQAAIKSERKYGKLTRTTTEVELFKALMN